MRGWLSDLVHSAVVVAAAAAQQPVTTSQYDSARTGTNTGETILTPRRRRIGTLRALKQPAPQPMQ